MKKCHAKILQWIVSTSNAFNFCINWDKVRQLVVKKTNNFYVLWIYRLWLHVKDLSTPSQQIGLLNKVPHTTDIDLTPQLSHPFAVYVFRHPLFIQTYGYSMTTYEGLEKTLQSLNEDLKRNPLQGLYWSSVHIKKEVVIKLFTSF